MPNRTPIMGLLTLDTDVMSANDNFRDHAILLREGIDSANGHGCWKIQVNLERLGRYKYSDALL